MVKKIIYGILFVSLSALIVFTSTRTANQNNEAGGAIIAFINNTFFGGGLAKEEQNSIVGVASKLLGHYGLFMITGLFFDLFLREFDLTTRKRLLIIGVYSLCIGSTGEIVQIFSSGRYPTPDDVLIDMAGFHMIITLRYALEKKA